MTRKDYELIAKVFREQRDEYLDTLDMRASALTHTAERMAVALEADNPRFDSGKFLEACGAW